MSEPTPPPEPVDGIIEPAPIDPVDFPDGRPIVVPVGGPPRSRSRRATVRWAVAFVVLALVVGTVSVAASFLAASGTTSAVEGWLPNGTLVYVEARADLPGNQGTQLAGILRKFPGFRDQAQSEMIVDQALTGILDKAGVSWSTDVKPWLGGEVGFAMTRGYFDSMSKLMSGNVTSILGKVGSDLGVEPSPVPDVAVSFDDGFTVLASVKDATAASTWVSTMMAKAPGGSLATSQYAGGPLSTFSLGGAKVSWTVRDNVLILGLDTTVRAAIDTGGKGTLAASADFKSARQAAPGGYLAFVYMNLRDYMAATMEMQSKISAQFGGASAGTTAACMQQLTAAMPGWLGSTISASDSSLRLDVVENVPAGMPASAAKNSQSASAAHLPASTVAAIEVRSFGSTVTTGWKQLVQMLSCEPSAKSSLDQVDGLLAIVGGLDGIVGWAGDASIGITHDGTTWGGGLVAVANDQAGANNLQLRIKGLVGLGGASMGLAYSEEPLGSATLSFITPKDGPRVALTVKDGVLYLGTEDFVKAAASASGASSLAGQSGYTDAIARAGGNGVQDVYVDIAAIRGALEALAGDHAGAAYKTGIQPYLAPFDRLAMVSSAPEGGVVRGHVVLVFK